jgi:class 3 adenylate cyclase/tetratricopeptide (TPR) repeat protein
VAGGSGHSVRSLARATRERRRGLDRQRQLTLMHVDLVGSTPLAERLDPEDLRDIVLTYHDICDRAVERYGGDIGSRAGDGLMAHFGLPLPHEDDATRAILAGLAILEAVASLAEEFTDDDGVPFQVRIGIHSGPVLVTEIGNRRDIVGSTANETARIEAAARPGTVAVSNATRLLALDEFDFDDIREVHLKGIAQPMIISTVTRRAATVRRSSPVMPFVGRSVERDRLLDGWTRVRDGAEQYAALLVGEAGIGKSRLADLVTGVAVRDGAHRVVLEHRSYDADVPFHGWEAAIEQQFRLDRSAPPAERLEQLTVGMEALGLGEGVPYVAALIGLTDELDDAPLEVAPSFWQQMTTTALLGLLDALRSTAPLVLLVEDLHWTDPSTRSLLDLLVGASMPGLMMVVTGRESRRRWGDAVEVIELAPLTADEVTAMGASFGTQMALTEEHIGQLIERSDGVPLYLDRLFDSVRRGDRYLHGGVPTGLDELLDSIVHGPGVDQRLVGVLAAVGRRFDVELAGAVMAQSVDEIRPRLDELCELGLLDRVSSSGEVDYRFHHAMIQTAAYESLLPSDRREAHARAAAVYERRPSTLTSDVASAARHFDLSDQSALAIPAYLRAGEMAYRRGAALESRRLTERGLELVREAPETPGFDAFELDLQLQLARCVRATEGYGADAAAVPSMRARELALALGRTPQQFVIECDLYSFHALRGDATSAAELLAALRATAAESREMSHVADQLEAIDLHRRGRYGEAATLYDRVIADTERHVERSPTRSVGAPADTLVSSLSDAALVRWQLGDGGRARRDLDVAIRRSRSIEGPESAFSEGYAMSTLGQLLLESGDVGAALDIAREGLTFSQRKGLLMWAGMQYMLMLIARAKVEPTNDNEGRLGRFVERQLASGTTTQLPYFMLEHARVCADIGRLDAAIGRLDEALTVAESSGERRHVAEILRRRAVIMDLDRGDRAEVVAGLVEAIRVAADQGACTYGARAVLDLDRIGAIGDLEPIVDLARGLFDGAHRSAAAGVIGDALRLLPHVESHQA